MANLVNGILGNVFLLVLIFGLVRPRPATQGGSSGREEKTSALPLEYALALARLPLAR
jgi:hypothetical protein